MFQKVIYKKKYDRMTVEEIEQAFLDDSRDFSENEKPMIEKESSSQDVFKLLNKGAVFVPLPEREQLAKDFIKQAILISETYQIDTEIREGGGSITAMYSFDCGGAMGFLKSVIQYADDISFFSNTNGYEIVLALDFYTHALYRHGRKMRP